MNRWQERSHSLNTLGFKDYGEYLKSGLWLDLRKEAMMDSDGLCPCGSPAVDVHHRDYSLSTMANGGDGLIPVCRACHRSIEFTFGRKAMTNDKIASNEECVRCALW